MTPTWSCHAWQVAAAVQSEHLGMSLADSLVWTQKQMKLLYTQVQYQSGTRRSCVVWTERLSPILEDMSSNPLCGQEPGALITYRWDPRGTVCSKIDQMTQFFFAASFKTHRFLDCLLWVIFSLRKWSSPRFTIGDNHCNRCRYSWGMAVLKIGMQ